jgi:hypothetical protein
MTDMPFALADQPDAAGTLAMPVGQDVVFGASPAF